MTNRIITTLVQLALLGVVIPLCYAIYQDLKKNGLN